MSKKITLAFNKLYPMGNSTVIVWDLNSEVEALGYKRIAKKLMQDTQLGCEQVGFIQKPNREDAVYKLHMMGGELCVNAIRALAYLIFLETGTKEMKIESSGTKAIFTAIIKNNENVYLNFEMDVEVQIFSKDLALIHMEGIAHFVEKYKTASFNSWALKMRLQSLVSRYQSDVEHYEAIGYIPYSKEDGIQIDPLIYVKDTQSEVHETACGSGSIAVAIHQKLNDKCTKGHSIRQPSGHCYTVDVKGEGPVKKIGIMSQVEFICKGNVSIHLDEHLIKNFTIH